MDELGFTAKNSEDHKHCKTCISRMCRVQPDNVMSCDLVNCPRGCPSRYHGCKETEHLLLCPEERVECTNHANGCPLQLPRKKLRQHLKTCPASVIFCSAEWNRSHLDKFEEQSSSGKPALLMKKTYVDCGQLDTALAMRDHRVLVDSFLAPRRTRRILRNALTRIYPAAPFGRCSSYSADSDGGAYAEASKDLSDDEMDSKWDSTKSWLVAQQGLAEKKAQLYDVSRQAASSLSSTLTYISDQMDSTVKEREASTNSSAADNVKVEDSWKQNEASLNPLSVNTDAYEGVPSQNEASVHGTAFRDKTLSPATSKEGRTASTVGSIGGVGSACSSSEREYSRMCDKQETVVQDGQALRSVLSVNMGVECIAKYQPKPNFTYTFLCAQEVRRDEFPHHFHAVHNRIQSDLNGWMEQRCPLAYLGCPFSFRRFRPSNPGMTICHSWLSESFGLTSLDPQGDHAHKIPSHLLPPCPEPGDVGVSENSMTKYLAQSDNKTLSDCIGSPSYRENCLSASSEKYATSAKDQQTLLSSAYQSTAQGSHVAASSNEVSVSYSSPSGGGPQTTENLFSNLLDSINLEENSPAQTVHSTDSLSNSIADRKDREIDQSRKIAGHHQYSDQQATDLRVRGMSPHQNSSTSMYSKPQDVTSGNPQPSCPGKSGVKGRQVMVTGITPSSPVRILHMSTSSDTVNSAAAPEGTVRTQLVDLPVEILLHITKFLDSFSLFNLSLVSRLMRELCCSLLQERGVVSLMWEKQRHGNDEPVWQVVGKRWSFSSCFEPVESWTFTGHNPIAQHLTTCPFNQDRFDPRDKFSIIPLSEEPLNVQIRDMLQNRLQRRRRVGRPRWYIAAMKTYVENLCENLDKRLT